MFSSCDDPNHSRKAYLFRSFFLLVFEHRRPAPPLSLISDYPGRPTSGNSKPCIY